MFTLILSIIGKDFANITPITGFETAQDADTAGADWFNSTRTPAHMGIEKNYSVAKTSARVIVYPPPRVGGPF
jgi:hypothetical protein